MPAAILGPIAGSVAGGLMSKGGQQTASKEPWAEAAPWLKDNIKQGQALQGYYQQNPFGPVQETGYQNLLASVDNYRDSVAPGLLAITNKYLQGGGSPGVSLLSNGQTAKSGAPMRAHGLLDFQAMNPYKNGALDPQVKAPTPEDEEARRRREEEERYRKAIEEYSRFA